MRRGRCRVTPPAKYIDTENQQGEVMIKVRVGEQVWEFDRDRIVGLLCGALEGGSNYWYSGAHIAEAPPRFEGRVEYKKHLRETGGHWWLDTPFDGGVLMLNDALEGTALRLGIDEVVEGLEKMAVLPAKRHWENLVKDNCDAETGDVFLQLALLGEVRYG